MEAGETGKKRRVQITSSNRPRQDDTCKLDPHIQALQRRTKLCCLGVAAGLATSGRVLRPGVCADISPIN